MQPGKNSDRAKSNPRKGNAEREAPPTKKPFDQVDGLGRVGEHVDAAADQGAKGEVQFPGLLGQRGQQQAAAHQQDAGFDNQPRVPPVAEPSDDWRHDCRDQETKRKGSGDDPASPPELIQDWRQQQGERGSGIDRDRHRDERHADQEPAVEKWRPEASPFSHADLPSHREIRFSGTSSAATRGEIFSAISLARSSSIPSVQPETCGVISTLGSSWKGRVAGAAFPGSRG